MSRLEGRRIVLGVTGGIAAYKAALLARLLVGEGARVDTVMTRGAREFIGEATFEGITGRAVRSEVWEDIPGETHVALAREADGIVVYPATAHLLARAAAGLADDLLTTTLLAATCPVVVAPAMHTEMWEHGATQDNVKVLRDRGVILVGPDEGELMGGDTGQGRVVEPAAALQALLDLLVDERLAGRTVVVTAGGTREPIDPVRFFGNPSSGKMGFAVAAAAARRGATVHLVTAPTHLSTPRGVTRHDVTTTREMHDTVFDLAPEADVIIKAAAVADFRPATTDDHKVKKAGGPPRIELVANPDILADLGEWRTGPTPILVGFAAETQDAERHGREKLERKGADLLVVNDVSEPDAGFGVDTNRVVLLSADGGRTEIPLTTKRDVAARLLDEVAALLH